MSLSGSSSSENRVNELQSQVLLKLSPIEWDSILLEAELYTTLGGKEQVSKPDAELLVDLRAESVSSLSVILDQVVGLLPQLWLDPLERCVGVCTDVEDLSSSGVVEANFLLELPL